MNIPLRVATVLNLQEAPMPEPTIVHKRDLSKCLLELDDNVFAGQIMPDAGAPHVRALLAEIGAGEPTQIELRFDHLGLYGWPADGVQARIDTDGGVMRLGWRLREWSGMLLIAEAHAIWEQPDGTLVDITPISTPGDWSLFAQDPAATRGIAHHSVLHVTLDRSAEIAARVASFKGGQRGYEERRAAKAGLSLTDWIAAKAFTDPLPEAIPAFIAACIAFTAKLSRLPDLIERRPDDYDDIADGAWHSDFETDLAQDKLVEWHLPREDRMLDIEAGMKALGLTDSRVPALPMPSSET